MKFPTAPIGALFDVRNGATPKSDNPDFWGGEVPWVTPADLGKLAGDTITDGEKSITQEGLASCGTQFVPQGSIVLSIRAPIGHLAVAGHAMCFNQGCRGLIPRKQIDTRFSYWALNSAKPTLEQAGQGTTFMELGRSKLRAVHVPCPDLPTQKRIAAFLDRETARIDDLIAKKQRLVKVLREKLDGEISRAVSIGIDPAVELTTEEELEWTLHRPRHWRLVRLKQFFYENTRYSNTGNETLLSLRMNEGLVPHGEMSDKEIPPGDLINYKKVYPGQIVMNRMRAAIGLFGLADRAGIVSPDYSVFDVTQDAHAGYFLRLFKTQALMSAFRLLSKGLGTGHSGFMRLNSDNFGRIRVAVPDFEEQRIISNCIEGRAQQTARLNSKNQQSIDRLREYRSVLITAAVTGQMDVSEWDRQGTADHRLDTIQEAMEA